MGHTHTHTHTVCKSTYVDRHMDILYVCKYAFIFTQMETHAGTRQHNESDVDVDVYVDFAFDGGGDDNERCEFVYSGVCYVLCMQMWEAHFRVVMG
jgi:hypothetical protein